MILLMGKHQFTVSSIDLASRQGRSPSINASLNGVSSAADSKLGVVPMDITMNAKELKIQMQQRKAENSTDDKYRSAANCVPEVASQRAGMEINSPVSLSLIVSEAEEFLNMMESIADLSIEEQTLAR